MAPKLIRRFEMMLGRYGVGEVSPPKTPLWTENDTVLITYADTVQGGENPLRTLRGFLCERLKNAIRTVHILPFCPWTSDDGFSVVDYREVKEEYGGWRDIEDLGSDFSLMFDLVLNHCSSESPWFRQFVTGVEPGLGYFVTADKSVDLSEVVRPRETPLLTTVATRGGNQNVWTTFSADQVDLNWKDPNVLFEFLDILFLYVAKGVRILRLDAVAFLWKEIGTNCLHLPETHEVVKLIRDVLEVVAPHVVVLTETNVPHEENVSYFGDGDEAHMVYNFSLPPLLLHALLRGDGSHLTGWAKTLPDLPEGQTFLNFTASHDGVGVRPLQGILDDSELDWVVGQVKKRGGKVSQRSMPDGSKRPYELNITYVDAMSEPGDEETSIARFLCSQAIMLAMRGVPALYIHSLLGTPNWVEGFEETKRNRTLNRRQYKLDQLNEVLDDREGKQSKIFDILTSWLIRRQNHPAFHPEAAMEVLDLGKACFGFVRKAHDGSETIVCLANLTAKPLTVNWSDCVSGSDPVESTREVLSGAMVEPGKAIELPPFGPVWLALT
tara:strand:+ start:4041 stop:5699 length:1659 start_codon:yes stop_codon:yes gene_type:complete